MVGWLVQEFEHAFENEFRIFFIFLMSILVLSNGINEINGRPVLKFTKLHGE